MSHEQQSRPSDLLQSWARLLDPNHIPGPVLDLACGDGRNGIYAARHGLEVICCDRSRSALWRARREAGARGVRIRLWWTDLEAEGRAPLPENTFGAVLVFRYLHRPLIPEIRGAVRPGGYVIYETFTTDQPQFGPPRNPDHLLDPGELDEWFRDWEVLHRFEGVLTDPDRAMAGIVARKASA